MKKLAMTLATAVLMLGLFAGTALAADPNPNPEDGYNEDLVSGLATSDTQFDKGGFNANATGKNVGEAYSTDNRSDVIKSEGMVNDLQQEENQRTHGEYQNNTNSCASCHQTHTAAAKNLLFKDGVYTTCTACHDGTLGFYNVFEGSTAGTFGGDVVEGNASMHLANSTVKISAAPGGNLNDNRGGTWTGEFNCASCHSAHGSYSDRLLNYNPNDMGNVGPENGGIKADKVGIFDLDQDSKIIGTPTTQYIGVRGTKAQHKLSGSKYDNIPTDAMVIMIYEKSGTTYNMTTTPWLYGYPVRGSGDNRHYYYSRLFADDTVFNTNGTYNKYYDDSVIDYYDQDKKDANGNIALSMDFGKGLIWATNGELANVDKVEISRAYIIKFDLIQTNNYGGVPIYTVNESAFFSGNKMDGTKASGLGVALSKYCAACHTDYMAHSGNETGTFNKAYRHSADSDSYTCVRCHFAHGTDRDIMMDAEGRTVEYLVNEEHWEQDVAEDYIVDKNPSSALKRYTNMAVCWGCHTSSHAEQLKNNDYYMNSDAEVPHGLTDSNVPAVSVDDVNNTIVGLDENMEFSLDGSTYTVYNGSNGPVVPGDNKKVWVRYTAASGVNPNPPVALTFTYRPLVMADDVNNRIVGLNTSMEYKIGEAAWVQYDGSTAPDLTDKKTVKVRFITPEAGTQGEVTLNFTVNS